MQVAVQTKTKSTFGNVDLYDRIQQDALMLIESFGVKASPVTAAKLLAAMPSDEAARITYIEEMDRIYITQDVIEACLERVRQGADYWPGGFGTGGMAAYIVDQNGPRSPESADMRVLAHIFGQTDILTNLQSSFNICNRVKRNDMETRARVECEAIDDMISGANGKLIMPTVLSDAAYDRLKHYYDGGHRVSAALSIISTYMAVSDEMVDPFLKAVTRGVPYNMNSMSIGGMTGPYSMSALATLAQAEAVFGLVLGQLIHPGIRCINAAMPTIADMSRKEMPMKFGSVSNTMLNILLAELNLYLGIPCCQSSCSHQQDLLDETAMTQSAEIYSLINQYEYQILRHMFGFSAQLNDFSIDNMQRQIALYDAVCKMPVTVEPPAPAEYDETGFETILEGLERGDFRTLDHTLNNIGRAFTR